MTKQLPAIEYGMPSLLKGWSAPDGRWTRVRGGDLPCPVTIRVERAPDGRYVVTGLLLGQHEHAEITWQTLRRVKVADILGRIFANFDPNNPMAWAEAMTAFERIDAAESETAFEPIDAAELASYLWEPPPPQGSPVQTRQRTRGPSDETLAGFAGTYATELAKNPQRAMTAAAETVAISRATAIRWAALCRQSGLLPPAVPTSKGGAR